jgi:RNA polymerase sigma-70 factor (ECF subfamily)
MPDPSPDNAPSESEEAARQGPVSAAPSASSEEDRALVRRALEGDRRAYDQLVRKYREPLARHVGRLIRDRDDVDDLTQEALTKALTQLASYDPTYAFSTWLYRIATNHSIDHLRRRKIATYSLDQPIRTRDGEMQAEVPDSTWRPDRHVVADKQRTLINEAIARLPEKYHRVIVLRHVEELAYEEIAEQLDLPLGTVKAHIFRARALLYRYLKDRQEDL